MKTVIIIALFLGMHITSYSQNKTGEGNDEGTYEHSRPTRDCY